MTYFQSPCNQMTFPKVPQNLLHNRSDLDAIAQGLWRGCYPKPFDPTPDGEVLWDFMLEHVLPACPKGVQKLPRLIFPYGSPEHLWCVWDALVSVRDLDFSRNYEAAHLLLNVPRWLKNPVSRITPRYNLLHSPDLHYHIAVSCVSATVNTGSDYDQVIVNLVAEVATKSEQIKNPNGFHPSRLETETYLRLRLLCMLSGYLDVPNPVW